MSVVGTIAIVAICAATWWAEGRLRDILVLGSWIMFAVCLSITTLRDLRNSRPRY